MPHAHFLSSATARLHLAVRLLKEAEGWQEGDEVVSTPLTFVSTNHAIRYERLRPVFGDVDEYLWLDPASVAERITPRPRAVVFVGMGGNTGRPVTQPDAVGRVLVALGLAAEPPPGRSVPAA